MNNRRAFGNMTLDLSFTNMVHLYVLGASRMKPTWFDNIHVTSTIIIIQKLQIFQLILAIFTDFKVNEPSILIAVRRLAENYC